MQNLKEVPMGSDIPGQIAVDLLSIPPLIFRIIRSEFVNTSLADYEIRLPHIEIMNVLKEDGTLHVAEIGERLRIAKARMTHLIDKLVNLELVERSIDTTDRRTINITITKKGRAILEKHEITITRAVGEYISGLKENELETLSTSLRNIRDILFKLQ
jgi:DNA-binding MarR family transcriptional regulator